MGFTPCPEGEPCAPFDEAPLACAPGLQALISDGTDCGPIDAADLLPIHAFAQGSVTGEVIVSTAAAGISASALNTLNISNPNCLKDGVLKCSLRASIELCPDIGATMTATPVLGGGAVPSQVITFESDAVEATCATFAIAFSETDLALIAPAGATSASFGFQIEGDGTATISDWYTECEVIPV